MEEMNCFHFTPEDGLDVYSIIKNEIGEIVRKSNKISFKSLLHEGTIDREKVRVEQIEIYYDQREHEDKATWVTYTFESSGVLVEAIVDIIAVIIHKFFAGRR
jgi:hypothetical protein